MQRLAMKIPVLKDVIIYNEVTTFTKTFASLLKHGVYITDTMNILMQITNNEIYRKLIASCIRHLRKGENISEAFKGHWAFPIPAYEMIVTGERTGKLAEMLEKVSEYYQGLHENIVSRMKVIIEPLLIIMLTVTFPPSKSSEASSISSILLILSVILETSLTFLAIKSLDIIISFKSLFNLISFPRTSKISGSL